MKKILRNCIWIVPAGILLGFLLLLLSFLFPGALCARQEKAAAAILKEEGTYPLEIYSQRQMDNYTDSLMLLEAADEGTESLLDKAVNIYHTAEKGRSPAATLADQLEPGTVKTYRNAYSRYWHGFLIFLKPAYALLGFNGIRTLNLAIQHGLLTALLLLLYRRRTACLLPFLLTVLFLAPTAIGKSLQFSSVYYIILIESILLLWNPKQLLSGDRVGYLFLFSGMLTAYLDLLTYPTAALTVPLVLLCVRELREETGRREALRRMLLCVLLWFVGYAGMWAGKWLIAAAYNGGDFVTGLLNTMKKRTSETNAYRDHVSRGRALWVNIKMMFENRHLLLLTAFYAIAQSALCLRSRGGTGKGYGAGLLLFLIPAAVPVGWNLLLSNHGTIHCWFTYRALAPALFSLLTALSLAAGRGEEREKRNG